MKDLNIHITEIDTRVNKNILQKYAREYAIIPTPLGHYAYMTFSSHGLIFLGFKDSATLDNEDDISLLTENKERGKRIINYFFENTNEHPYIHLIGNAFELMVWRSLLNIKRGYTASYSEIAQLIKKPLVVRAVATAIGNNPISLIIPCHRIIYASGKIGNYHWGNDLKIKLLKFEQMTATAKP